eukprot:7030591-Ditylum_brightwellii.AAC.1
MRGDAAHCSPCSRFAHRLQPACLGDLHHDYTTIFKGPNAQSMYFCTAKDNQGVDDVIQY